MTDQVQQTTPETPNEQWQANVIDLAAFAEQRPSILRAVEAAGYKRAHAQGVAENAWIPD